MTPGLSKQKYGAAIYKDRKDLVGSKSVLRGFFFFFGHVEMPIRNSNGVIKQAVGDHSVLNQRDTFGSNWFMCGMNHEV